MVKVSSARDPVSVPLPLAPIVELGGRLLLKLNVPVSCPSGLTVPDNFPASLIGAMFRKNIVEVPEKLRLFCFETLIVPLALKVPSKSCVQDASVREEELASV